MFNEMFLALFTSLRKPPNSGAEQLINAGDIWIFVYKLFVHEVVASVNCKLSKKHQT